MKFGINASQVYSANTNIIAVQNGLVLCICKNENLCLNRILFSEPYRERGGMETYASGVNFKEASKNLSK